MRILIPLQSGKCEDCIHWRYFKQAPDCVLINEYHGKCNPKQVFETQGGRNVTREQD